MATTTGPLPDDFPCPVCGENKIAVNAEVLVDLEEHDPVYGHPYYLAEHPRWFCQNRDCGETGELDEAGPLVLPDDHELRADILTHRYYRRHAHQLLDLASSLSLFSGDKAAWTSNIDRASFSQLMSLIHQLEAMLNFPGPEPLPASPETPTL